MTISRRNVLSRALALGAGAAVLPTITPADAARLLDLPAAAPLPELGGAGMLDPIGFADDVECHIDLDGEPVSFINPDDYAEYKRLRMALVESLPILNEVRSNHPFHTMDEAAHAWALGAYMHGVRAGAAYEHLRIALIGPRQSCRRCDAKGFVGPAGRWIVSDRLEDRRPCPDCGGAGVVAVRG